MRYLFRYTYNPEQANLDKVRKVCIVEASGDDVMAAIGAGIAKLKTAISEEEIVREYLDAIGDENTTDGWEWQAWGNDGVYNFEWRPFEAADPVTIDAIYEWALQVIGGIGGFGIDGDGKDQLQPFLAALMSRWSWRLTSWCSKHELQEQLHQMTMEGGAKGLCEMSIAELLTEVKDGPMRAAIDNFDEIEKGPLGLSAMVESDRELWRPK